MLSGVFQSMGVVFVLLCSFVLFPCLCPHVSMILRQPLVCASGNTSVQKIILAYMGLESDCTLPWGSHLHSLESFSIICGPLSDEQTGQWAQVPSGFLGWCFPLPFIFGLFIYFCGYFVCLVCITWVKYYHVYLYPSGNSCNMIP